MFDNKVLGISMSGGGALGFAHLGALQALEEAGCNFQYISGSSMGALIGIFYASGMSAKDISRVVKEEKMYHLFRILSPNLILPGKKPLGFASHKSINNLFEKYIPYETFEELPRHLSVCVVNISQERCEYVCSGPDLKRYVLASMTQPAIFNPIVINGDYYVDGGVLNNMPTRMIRDKCDIVIGVDVHPHTLNFKMKSLSDVAMRVMQVVIHNNSAEGRSLCDFLIEPKGCEKYNVFDFNKFNTLYKIGYKAAQEAIMSIKNSGL